MHKVFVFIGMHAVYDGESKSQSLAEIVGFVFQKLKISLKIFYLFSLLTVKKIKKKASFHNETFNTELILIMLS
jgi:hypothetical protein